MANLGKRTRSIRETVKNKENLSVEDAVALVKSNATAKFDETIEIAMNLGVDTRHADQMVRGVIGLPNGTGKSVRVAVFARGPKAEEAQAAGADIVGAEDLMETVQGGTIDFGHAHVRNYNGKMSLCIYNLNGFMGTVSYGYCKGSTKIQFDPAKNRFFIIYKQDPFIHTPFES